MSELAQAYKKLKRKGHYQTHSLTPAEVDVIIDVMVAEGKLLADIARDLNRDPDILKKYLDKYGHDYAEIKAEAIATRKRKKTLAAKRASFNRVFG